MNSNEPAAIKLENDSASLTIDLFGGAITEFRLKDVDVNPLSFAFSKDQMPSNNKAGANYQGHFLCAGRWGKPSAGEIKAGIPDHGEPANIAWTITASGKNDLQMNALAQKEGLQVERNIVMDTHEAVYAVKEAVTNINFLGRTFNMVQHPTLAAPFLDQATIIDCNASKGFDQAHYKEIEKNIIQWHMNNHSGNNFIGDPKPGTSCNAVYSFVVEPQDEYGWITAFSQTHHLLFGYVWKRTQYPWIHLWQHFVKDKIQYRGLEFGTAGIHQPFREMLDTATTIFGEKTYEYIDAGETIAKNYLSFIHATGNGFSGVEDISLAGGELIIKSKEKSGDIHINPAQSLLNEL